MLTCTLHMRHPYAPTKCTPTNTASHQVTAADVMQPATEEGDTIGEDFLEASDLLRDLDNVMRGDPSFKIPDISGDAMPDDTDLFPPTADYYITAQYENKATFVKLLTSYMRDGHGGVTPPDLLQVQAEKYNGENGTGKIFLLPGSAVSYRQYTHPIFLTWLLCILWTEHPIYPCRIMTS